MPTVNKKITLENVIHQAITDKVRKQECSAIALMNVDAVNSKVEVHSMAIMPGAQDAAEIAEIITSRAEIFASGSDRSGAHV